MVVCDDGEWKVSQGTQTGISDLVQITASYAEMLRRIDSFVRYKRQQVDIYNQMEFCRPADPGTCENAPLRSKNTCARIDAQYIKRGSSSNHIETVRIHNECGPSANQLTPLELLQRDLAPQTRKLHVSALLGLPERLSNLEKYLDLYSDTLAPRDMVERIRRLEMRILELEGQSPEYPNQQEVNAEGLNMCSLVSSAAVIQIHVPTSDEVITCSATPPSRAPCLIT
ncbi:hypothetical protein EMCRGX_G032351 [Ephydatia muelleri]